MKKKEKDGKKNTSKEKEMEKSSRERDTSVYINRELSWLKFNQRVLEESMNPSVPLCERMTFLSIYQSNLDEFFMVRVGSLEDQKLLPGQVRENKTYMTPKEQISQICKKVAELNQMKDDSYYEVFSQAEKYGIKFTNFQALSVKEEKILEHYFKKEILPLLSVMIVGRKQPFPFLKGQEIYAFAHLVTKSGKEKIGIVPCSSQVFPRLIEIQGKPGTYMLSEELILHYLPKVFAKYHITEKTLLRLTRNADIDINKVYDEDLNYRDQMAEVVKLRRKLAPVRVEMTREITPKMLKKICEYCDVSPKQVFYSATPLELSFLFGIEDVLRKDSSLVYEKRVPQPSPALKTDTAIIPQILEKDVLLSYPYESIKPFLQMLSEAAKDPKVISIRMTLYRLASDSKIVEALVEAVENGKQVDVLVELKARFDEANNIEWSRRLEEAGCHVVYGIDGFKVHSKVCQITRKEGDEIQYITQIGTGNYNEKTSKLYTDLSLITANKEIGEEASMFFRAILLGETTSHTEHLLVAPKCLQAPVLSMIQEEISQAKQGKPAYIGIKINSLTDKRIMEKLIEASQAGVQIDMVVRGICCLQSQVPGMTENIRIKSIVGRFLEHSRIYIFGTTDREKIYISSADFMTRNTLRRVEVAVPIYDKKIRKRIRTMFGAMMIDSVKGRVQQQDGSYRIVEGASAKIDSQELFYADAYEAANLFLK